MHRYDERNRQSFLLQTAGRRSPRGGCGGLVQLRSQDGHDLKIGICREAKSHPSTRVTVDDDPTSRLTNFSSIPNTLSPKPRISSVTFRVPCQEGAAWTCSGHEQS